MTRESRDWPFRKWHYYKAQTSLRWGSLTVTQKGVFHELQDHAAMSSVRGSLYMKAARGTVRPLTDTELAASLRISETEFADFLAIVKDVHGLMDRDSAGALFFTDWAKHQRKSPCRPPENPSATTTSTYKPTGQELGTNGAKPGQKLDTDVEGDVEVDEEREREKASATPEQRLLSLSFPSGSPSDNGRAAVIDRAHEAIRVGATWPFLGWAVISRKAKGKKPWDRITEAGEYAADLLAETRSAYGAGKRPCTAMSLHDLGKNHNWKTTREKMAADDRHRGLVNRILAALRMTYEWPPQAGAKED